MTPIPDDVIEQIRDAADIVELIGEHVALKRTGSDYRGPCPFHGGTHRNLAVIPKKQMFYCFVCHEAGDVFTFYMKRFGMDYPTAVRELGRQVGISIPDRPAGAGPDPREPLYTAVSAAAEWYARSLRDSKEAAAARAYLERRGFSVERYPELGFGYAPAGSGFREGMQKLGIGDELMSQAGLLVRRDDGTLRPRFWNRLLYPIRDLRGRVVGFGGRVLGDGEPKYLNSPDSPIFHKGSLLYNLDRAKLAIRHADHAIIVEGYFDALRLSHVGVEHVVAPLGTAFTPQQAQLLKRYTKHVTIFFDSDDAGLRATFRVADELLRAPVRVTVATAPKGEDPDSLAAKGGAEVVNSVMRDAIDVCERKLQLIERVGWLSDLAGKRRALDRLLPTLSAARDPVTRDLYVARISETLGISQESIRREIEVSSPTARPRHSGEEPSRAQPKSVVGADRGGPERDLIRVMINEPEWRDRIAENIGDLSIFHQPERELFELIASTKPGTPGGDLVTQAEGRARTLLAELLAEGWGELDVDAIVSGALNKLDSRRLEGELRELQRRLPLASEDKKPELVRKVDSLSRQIAKLNPGRWTVIRKGRSVAS